MNEERVENRCYTLYKIGVQKAHKELWRKVNYSWVGKRSRHWLDHKHEGGPLGRLSGGNGRAIVIK